jgi:dienelactone hydrolase
MDMNLLVVMPDFFDGEPVVKSEGFGGGFFHTCGLLCWALRPGNVSKFVKMYSEGKIQSQTMDHIVPFMKNEVSKIATVGFCAGAVMTFYLSGTGAFECGVSFHPSLHSMLPKVGVDPLDVCSDIKCKQFVMVTKDEPKDWQVGNSAQTTCDKAVSGNVWKSTEQSHGYFTRGDIESDVDTAKAVANGYSCMKIFLEQNLIGSSD